MSSARHAVVFGPSFTLFGYFPVRTPAHQVDLPMGTSFKIAGRRKYPLSSNLTLSVTLPPK